MIRDLHKAALIANQTLQQTASGSRGPVGRRSSAHGRQACEPSLDGGGRGNLLWSGTQSPHQHTSTPTATLAPTHDRTELLRLKITLRSKGTWLQIARIEALCASWPPIIVYRTRRNDRVTQVTWVKCLVCGASLDPQLEHSETCSKSITRVSTPCKGCLKLADPVIRTETSRTHRIDIKAGCPLRGSALDVCVASSNAAAARGDSPRAAVESNNTWTS